MTVLVFPPSMMMLANKVNVVKELPRGSRTLGSWIKRRKIVDLNSRAQRQM